MLVLIPNTDPTAAASGGDWFWVRSGDGLAVDDHGQAPANRLSADPQCVLLVPPQQLSWHHVRCPKVPASRLRAVLDGLLEDRLLDDAAQLHFALAPGARAGQTFWVAACNLAWLRQQLAALAASGHVVQHIRPLVWPQETGQCLAHQQAGLTWMTACGPQGVLSLPLEQTSAPGALTALLHNVLGQTAADAGQDTSRPCLAEPAAAAMAEQALGHPPDIQPAHQLWLRLAQGPWDLAQFEFSRSAQARRGQWLRASWHDWRHAPAWRPARWGLVALLLVQVATLNLQAWQGRQQLQRTQAQARALLTETFPQTRLVLDAPVQMRRALADLRQNSGQLASGDLEHLLHNLAPAQPRFTALEFVNGEATLRGFQAGASHGLAALQQAGWQRQPDNDPTVLTLKARP